MADSIADFEPNFTATLGVYQLCEDVSEMDLIDQLQARSGHLVATLGMITGDGHQHFASRSADAQERYLWSCELAAREIQSLLMALCIVRRRDSTAGV